MALHPLRATSACFKMSLYSSLALLALSAMQWWLVELIAPFGLFVLPLVWLVVLLTFAAAVSWSLGCVFAGGPRAAGPLIICTMTAAIWWFAPFTQMFLAVDWRLHRSARERVVAKVLRGNLRPNLACCPQLIALGTNEPKVSMGGKEIAVEVHGGQTYVFFYTFRGILDNYSGFLFVSGDGDPTEYSDLNESTTQLVAWAPHWYWAAHR